VHGVNERRHKPHILQTYYELFPTQTGVTVPCITSSGEHLTSQTRPYRLQTPTLPHLPQPSTLYSRACSCPLASNRTRNARAPTSPHSIGFCAIWESISSSSNSKHRPLCGQTWPLGRPAFCFMYTSTGGVILDLTWTGHGALSKRRSPCGDGWRSAVRASPAVCSSRLVEQRGLRVRVRKHKAVALFAGQPEAQ